MGAQYQRLLGNGLDDSDMTNDADEQRGIERASLLPVARVAWEVSRNVAISFGDFTKGPWECRTMAEQEAAVDLAVAYINTPSMTPSTLAVKLESQQDRAIAYAFYGTVRGIAQEQTRT